MVLQEFNRCMSDLANFLENKKNNLRDMVFCPVKSMLGLHAQTINVDITK